MLMVVCEVLIVVLSVLVSFLMSMNFFLDVRF